MQRPASAMRGLRLLLLSFVASVLLVLGLASPATAHASLIEAEPADGSRVEVAPEQIVLRFTEPVSVSGDSVRVLGVEGGRADDGRPEARDTEVTVGVDRELTDGTYVVAWRVVSADGHPIHGATTFIVGDGPRASDETIAGVLGDQGDGIWPLLGAIARALAYTGGLLVIGAAAWVLGVDRGRARRPARRVALAGAGIGAIGLLATIPVQAALNTGLGVDAATDWSLLSDAMEGPLGAGVLLAAIGLGLIAIGFGRPRPTAVSASTVTAPSGTRVDLTTAVAAVGALLVAIGFARSGHTETTDPRALMFGADVVHVLAAGAWLGGLVLLGWDLLATRRGTIAVTTTSERVARFSTVAAFAAIGAAIAGLVLAWGTVRNFDALTSTTYGRVLLVKVGLVSMVGVLAVVNNRWLVPAVRAGEANARRVLFDTVRIEALGLLAAVVVTAALVNIEPARLANEGGLYETTVPFGEGNAVVQIDPARAGENAVHVYLLDDVGRQFDLPVTPSFAFSLPEQDVGPITRTPWRVGRGHYTLDGSEMSLRGTWTLEIRARVSDFDEYVATIEVPIR